jgi:hypothetical protein
VKAQKKTIGEERNRWRIKALREKVKVRLIDERESESD